MYDRTENSECHRVDSEYLDLITSSEISAQNKFVFVQSIGLKKKRERERKISLLIKSCATHLMIWQLLKLSLPLRDMI